MIAAKNLGTTSVNDKLVLSILKLKPSRPPPSWEPGGCVQIEETHENRFDSTFIGEHLLLGNEVPASTNNIFGFDGSCGMQKGSISEKPIVWPIILKIWWFSLHSGMSFKWHTFQSAITFRLPERYSEVTVIWHNSRNCQIYLNKFIKT